MPLFPHRIPNVVHHVRVKDEDGNFQWTHPTSHEIVGRGKNIIFSLPGAFTPTCSTYQLPDFEKLFPKFQEHGIENIFCLSVNDTFVMNCWAKDQNLKHVKVIPDGSGQFTGSMGMDVYKDNIGFGVRSWRYAIIVENYEIIKQFVERGFMHNAEDDPYGVSSPQNILDFLDGKEYDAGGEQLQLNLSDGVGSEDKIG